MPPASPSRCGPLAVSRLIGASSGQGSCLILLERAVFDSGLSHYSIASRLVLIKPHARAAESQRGDGRGLMGLTGRPQDGLLLGEDVATTLLYPGALRGCLGCSQGTNCIPVLAQFRNALMGHWAPLQPPLGEAPMNTLLSWGRWGRPSTEMLQHKAVTRGPAALEVGAAGRRWLFPPCIRLQ